MKSENEENSLNLPTALKGSTNWASVRQPTVGYERMMSIDYGLTAYSKSVETGQEASCQEASKAADATRLQVNTKFDWSLLNGISMKSAYR